MGLTVGYARGKRGDRKRLKRSKGRQRQGNCQHCSKNCPHKLASSAASLSLDFSHRLLLSPCTTVDRPVNTPCSNLVCAECISSLAESSLQCPCCKEHHELSPTLFVPASDVVLKVIGALLIQILLYSGYECQEHVKSGCEAHIASFSPSKLTMKQIISRPLQSPPTDSIFRELWANSHHQCVQ